MLYVVTLTYILKVIKCLEIYKYTNLWKRVRASEKCSRTTSIEVYIRYKTAEVSFCYHTIFQGQKFKILSPKRLRPSSKMPIVNFIQVYIRHRMAHLRMMYVTTLKYIFTVTILKCEYLENGES